MVELKVFTGGGRSPQYYPLIVTPTVYPLIVTPARLPFIVTPAGHSLIVTQVGRIDKEPRDGVNSPNMGNNPSTKTEHGVRVA